jgi:hypothetical protein
MGETFPACQAEDRSKDSYVVMFRDNKDMNCFENYKGNLELSKYAVGC